MAEPFHGLVDGKEYELVIGSSFRQKQTENFYHTIKYDFKPASVDSSKASELTVGSNNEVTVKVPHIQESESTVFKGSKRPCNKECILIIDRETGEVTLEKLASNIQLKKIRSSNQAQTKTISSPAQPVAKISSKPTAHKKRVASKGDNPMSKIDGDTNSKKDKPKEKAKEKQSIIPKHPGKVIASKPLQNNESTSPSSHATDSDSSSSSSESDSDSDQDDTQETREQAKALDEALMQEIDEYPAGNINLIDDDLKLTDSESD